MPLNSAAPSAQRGHRRGRERLVGLQADFEQRLRDRSARMTNVATSAMPVSTGTRSSGAVIEPAMPISARP